MAERLGKRGQLGPEATAHSVLLGGRRHAPERKRSAELNISDILRPRLMAVSFSPTVLTNGAKFSGRLCR